VLDNSQQSIAEMVIPDAVDRLIQDGDIVCDVIISPDSRQ